MWNIKMKITFLAVLLIFFVKIVSSSDDKDKMPKMDDSFTFIIKDKNKSKNLSDTCDKMESKEKKETFENQDKSDEFGAENMDLTSPELFSTPLKPPSLRTEGMINPEESPVKPRLVFYTHDGVSYRVNPSLKGRYTKVLNEKDQKLQERRQARLFARTAFRKRCYSDSTDYEVPRKTRDTRSSPNRERKPRVFHYDKKDEDENDEDNQIQIDQLTAGLSKATLEEMEEDDKNEDPVVNLFDKINEASDSIVDNDTGESIKNKVKKNEEDEDDSEEDENYEPQEGDSDTDDDSDDDEVTDDDSESDDDDENDVEEDDEVDDSEDDDSDDDDSESDDSSEDECDDGEIQEGADVYPYVEFNQ